MTDSLVHWVRTQQDANVPLVQLQDPTPTRGPGLLVVTDDQRASLWSAANRERARLLRKRWYESAWGKMAVLAALVGAFGEVWQVVHR